MLVQAGPHRREIGRGAIGEQLRCGPIGRGNSPRCPRAASASGWCLNSSRSRGPRSVRPLCFNSSAPSWRPSARASAEARRDRWSQAAVPRRLRPMSVGPRAAAASRGFATPSSGARPPSFSVTSPRRSSVAVPMSGPPSSTHTSSRHVIRAAARRAKVLAALELYRNPSLWPATQQCCWRSRSLRSGCIPPQRAVARSLPRPHDVCRVQSRTRRSSSTPSDDGLRLMTAVLGREQPAASVGPPHLSQATGLTEEAGASAPTPATC